MGRICWRAGPGHKLPFPNPKAHCFQWLLTAALPPFAPTVQAAYCRTWLERQQDNTTRSSPAILCLQSQRDFVFARRIMAFA